MYSLTEQDDQDACVISNSIACDPSFVIFTFSEQFQQELVSISRTNCHLMAMFLDHKFQTENKSLFVIAVSSKL